MFDDFDLQIQCEEYYDESLDEIVREMQEESNAWFFAHLDEISQEELDSFK